MTSNSVQILIAQAEPGMVLSEDLLDHQGQVLLPKASVLNESLIKGLHRHDIAAICIVGAQSSPEEQARTTARHAQRIAILFRQIAPDAAGVSNELRNYVRTFRLGDDA